MQVYCKEEYIIRRCVKVMWSERMLFTNTQFCMIKLNNHSIPKEKGYFIALENSLDQDGSTLSKLCPRVVQVS